MREDDWRRPPDRIRQQGCRLSLGLRGRRRLRSILGDAIESTSVAISTGVSTIKKASEVGSHRPALASAKVTVATRAARPY
jgi:hypothetical protein